MDEGKTDNKDADPIGHGILSDPCINSGRLSSPGVGRGVGLISRVCFDLLLIVQ